MPTLRTRRGLFAIATLALLVITALIFWPGLHGPFLLDDVDNLLPIHGWLDGLYSWQYVVFGNRSGPTGRPVSMATFLLDAAITRSMDSVTFKPTNLLIHGLCGLAMLWLAWQVLRHWLPTRRHAGWIALALAAWWLWLPLNVDSVLYVIQRMAQLSTLFMLLALGCYMAARERIARGRLSGHLLLWIGVPVLTVLATYSKENGVLVFPLALVLEWFLYREDGWRRPASIKLFLVLTVALPFVLGLVYFAMHPTYFSAGYAARDFTLGERLLTEPRILWCYVQTLLVPIGAHMGFFQDNYPVSTALLQPRSTLPAIVAWLALVIAAWLWRKGNPLFAIGVFFYLVGQSLESGPIALELYFEHRNYLPSFGVLLAVVGLLAWAWQRIPAPTPMFRRACTALLACALGLYALATWGHVQSWRTGQTFYAAQQLYNPLSPRLQSDLTGRALEAHDLQGALLHIELGQRDSPASERATATLWRFLAYCNNKVAPPAALYAEYADDAHGRITTFAMKGMELLAATAEKGCPGLDAPRFEAITRTWLHETPTPATVMNVWRTRYNLGRIVAASGHIADARELVQRAWLDGNYNNGIGVLLFQLNASLGDVAGCREVLARLERAAGGGDHRVDEAVASFQHALADREFRTAPAASAKPPP